MRFFGRLEGSMVNEAESEPVKVKKVRGKTGGSETGTKGSGARGRTGKVKAAAHGSERLKKAAARQVGRNCGKLTKLLMDKALEGNLDSVKLLVTLAEPKKGSEKPVKKRRGPSLAERIAAEPLWEGPDVPEEDGYNGDPDTL
ncbi:MAG: hypothetical protein WBE72_12270 [Terracidiphilus sp.]